jgi:signal transduction histidine kinase
MLEHTVSSKKRLALIAVFLVVFLAVLMVTTIALYQRAKRHLDDELGERLEAVASGLARVVAISHPETLSTHTISPEIFPILYDVSAENELSNVVILTVDGRTVVDLEGFSEPGEPNPFVDLDFSAVTLARSGLAANTNLYKTGNIYMKSAYAPIKSAEDDVIGLMGVEAGAGFFDDLRELSNVIVFILGASIIVVTVLGLLFYRQTAALDRAQAAIIKRENLATMGRMVANIAHDIRNPLSIIKTSAQRLRKKYGTDDEIFSYISDEVDELNGILTSYLDFAGSQRPTTFEAHSLERIVHRCLLVIEPEVQSRNIEFKRQDSPEDVAIRVDDKRAQQAVMNVLMNALQAVSDGGSIEITIEKRRPYGVIVVSDDGCGIDSKNIKDVTKPFFTTRADGSGLGLSIVNAIIEQHDGRMVIGDRPGGGTIVELMFPLADRGLRH